MNPQAIQDAYTLFVGAGYKKDIESFKKLIKTNPNALNDAHTLFSQHGYKGGIDGFKVLMGLSDEELKKKDEPQTSGEESTEPQEQPTTPSAKPTPKAPLPSTPNELLYTGALKGLGGEKKESILTQTKPKQEPIDVTYQKEEMPSETTQGVVPITSKQRIQEAKKAEEEIKRGELPSNPNFITKETEAKVDARRKELGMNTLQEEFQQNAQKRKEQKEYDEYEYNSRDLSNAEKILGKSKDEVVFNLENLKNTPEYGGLYDRYTAGLETVIPGWDRNSGLGGLSNASLRIKAKDYIYKNYLADYDVLKNQTDEQGVKIKQNVSAKVSDYFSQNSASDYMKDDETLSPINYQFVKTGEKVVDMDKVNDLAERIIGETGSTANFGYARDLIIDAIKNEVNQEIIKPEAEKILKGEQAWQSTKPLREVIESPAFIYSEAKNEYQKATGKAWDENEHNVGITAKTRLALDNEYKSIEQQAKAEQDELLKTYEDLVELARQQGTEAPNPDVVNEKIAQINSKYEQRWQRAQNAILERAQVDLEEAYKKFSEGFKLDPSIQEKFEKAYNLAYQQAAKNRDKRFDVAAAEKGLPMAQFGRTYMTALGGSLKGYGAAYDNQTLKDIGNALEQNFYLSPAEVDGWNSLLEGEGVLGNLQKLSGMLAGSMTTGLAASTATAIMTGGTGVVPAIAASVTGFLAETAEIAGRAKQEMFLKTGSVSKANKAYEDSWRAQYNIAGLYAFEGLPFIGKALKFAKTKALRIGIGAGVEYTTEVPQEFTQGIHEENIAAGLDPWEGFYEKANPFGGSDAAKLARKRHEENLITLTPTLGMGGAGQIRSTTAKTDAIQAYSSMKAKEDMAEMMPDLKSQWIQNMYQSSGAKFASGVLSSMHQAGQITTEEFAELNTELERVKSTIETAKENGITKKGDINLFSFLSRQAKKARQNSEKYANSNPGLSKFWEAKAKEYEDESANFLNGKTPNVFTVTYSDGSQSILTEYEAKLMSKNQELLGLLEDGGAKIEAYRDDQKAFMDELRASVESRRDNINNTTQGIVSEVGVSDPVKVEKMVMTHPNYKLMTAGEKAALSFKLKELSDLVNQAKTNPQASQAKSIDQVKSELSDILNYRKTAPSQNKVVAEANKFDREIYVLNQKQNQFVTPRVAELMQSSNMSKGDATKQAQDEWQKTNDGKRYAELQNQRKELDAVARGYTLQDPSKVPLEIVGIETQETKKEEEKAVETTPEITPATSQMPTVGAIVAGANVLEPESIEERKRAVQSEGNPELTGLGRFSKDIGKSNSESVPVGRSMSEGKIETIQYANPNTGDIDLIISATPNLDYVAYIRIYDENGNPTNRWTSKMEAQKGSGFSEVISEAQKILPEGHEWTEGTSVSTDGLRVFSRGTEKGYEVQYDENGKIVTNKVALNVGARSSEELQQGGVQITEEDKKEMNSAIVAENDTKTQENVRKILAPYMKKMGLNESNIYFENGKVYIDLPVLKKSKRATNDQKNQTGLPSQVGVGQESVTTQPIQTTGKEEAPTGGVLQAEEEVVPEALKDVESTAKALEGTRVAPLEALLLGEIAAGKIEGKTSNQVISEAYHADKSAGKETELTKAVEELLGKPTEGTGKAAPEAKAEAPKPAEETKPTETGTTVSVGGGTTAGKMRQRRNTRKGIAPTEAKEEQKPPKEEGEKPSATKELEVTPSVRRAGAVEATESSNPDAGEDSALQAAGMTAQEVQEWKKNNRAQNKRPKIEQLTQAVKDLMSGKKSFKDYYKMAKELMPSKLMEKVPTPATFKEIIGAIDSNQLKIGIVGLNKFVKKGMRVGLRIDIPSFNNHGKNVVTVHDRSKAGQEVVGYGSTGSIKNVTFRTSVPTAAKIGAGKTAKSPFAMAEGEWMDESPESIQKRAEEALNSPEWVQVGMNPARNSFFFDKSDNNPVVSADEVIQVGNLVLAKNPKKIDLNTAEGMAEFEKMFSKTDKDTGVTYQYRQAPSQKTGEVQTGRKFTGRSAVNRLVDFLKSANIDIQVVSDQEFQEIQKGTNLTGSVDGLFATDEKSGKIYLRESRVDTHFGDTLAFHEGIHPVMNIVANTNPKLYNAIFEGLKSWSKENTDAGRAIREVIERQLALAEELGWDPATLKDETIVEALATIVAKGLSIPKTQIGLRNSIIDFYNKIAKFLKLPTISRNATDADFRAFVNKLTNAIREGGDIRDVVGKENVKEFKNNIVGAELYQASITRFGESGIQKSPILDDDKFIQLLDKDQLNVKSPIESLGDELFMLTFPDDLFVGEIIIDEKTVAKFGGGVVYALVEGSNGRMWASVDENTARSFAANINKALEQSKDGFARVVLVKGSHIKHASSLQAKVGFMKTLLNFARGNSDFESQVMDAIREAYTINSTTLEGAINELDEYMAGSREGSGQTMGEAANSYAVFRSGLVKKANPMLADLVKKMGYGNEFFDAGGLKKSPPVYRVKNEFVDKIFADMLQEDFLNNLPEGSAYAVLKVTSPVKWEKDASHPSYPFVIKTIDGSPVIVDLLTSSFMTYGKDEAISGRKEKPGKESSAFGRASYTVPAYKLKPNVDENTPGAVSLSKKLLQYKGVATKFQPPKKGTKQKAQGSPSQQREMEPSLVDEAGLTKHMTEDDNGNYIFYHKTNKPLKTIDPKFFGKTLATSRGERPGVGISMYYTRPDAGESMVAGGYGYIVRVPKDKVYPINEDPLGLYEQAKKMFEKDYPGQAFDPNKQVGYITKLAGEMGFPMTVASWQKGPLALRAQSTTALKPEVHHTPSDYSTTAIDINQEIDVLEPNEVKIRREKRRAKGSPSQERPAEIGKYDPLPGAPTPKDATGPIKELVDIAEKYAQDNNIPYTRQGEYVEVDKEFAKSVAEAYAKMKHDPTNPRVIEAYNDLIRQTRDQYDRLIEAGYEFSFFDSETDPYNTNPMEAMRDLRKNKKMAVYGTYDGFGTEGITATELQNNPLLQDTGLRWKDQNGKEQVVTANDLFRAVHDAFGHGLEGAGFRARGEENAWQAHVRLFYGPAVGAITSETRGQNSWLNFNTDLYRNAVGDEKAKEMHPDNWETITVGEHNQRAQTNDTIFAEQKTGLMPEWTWTERRAQGSPSQQRGMDPEAAYDEVERMIEDGEASGMNGQQMYDSISKTEAYASLSPEDRTLVNDSIRSMGGITADPAASSIMSYDPGEKAAVLEALRDNKDLAYIYRNFREILTDLKEKGVIETDCI